MEDIKIDSIDVARHLMALLSERDIGYGNIKIQKLLYIIYGAYLALYGEEAFSEEPRYFPYGPMFPRVYRQMDKHKLTPLTVIFKKEHLNEVIEEVIEVFGEYTGRALSNWSHKEDSPWFKIKEQALPYNTPLDKLDIQRYFKKNVLKVTA